jgi:hypothetical protein
MEQLIVLVLSLASVATGVVLCLGGIIRPWRHRVLLPLPQPPTSSSSNNTLAARKSAVS